MRVLCKQSETRIQLTTYSGWYKLFIDLIITFSVCPGKPVPHPLGNIPRDIEKIRCPRKGHPVYRTKTVAVPCLVACGYVK